MQRLVEAHLFGAGLIDVDTPVLTGRYNDCLQQLGIEPTELQKFRIDGMGWSPEIAVEKNNNFYLSSGIPNHLAIIISPDQNKKPIYFPFNSYDRRMMEAYFQEYGRAIEEITRTVCIGLDIDQEITQYASPKDLLLVDYIIIRSIAGQLMETAREQRELVAKFNEEPLAWFDKNFRGQIIRNAKNYGDLRFRRIEVTDMRFDDLRSFYTRAFGGVFIIRDIIDESNLLVIEEEKLASTCNSIKKDICYWLNEPELITYLRKENLIECNLIWYQSNLKNLENIKDWMIIDAICQDDPSLDYSKLNPASRKRRLINARQLMPEAFSELERLILRLEHGHIPLASDLSPELQLILLRPIEEQRMSSKRVLWQLIGKLQKLFTDPLILYTYDKEDFFQQYQKWPESKKACVVHILQRQYVPIMNS